MRKKILAGTLIAAAMLVCQINVFAAGETIEEQVLLDSNGVKITAKALDIEGGFMGPELKLLIENNTDANLTVQTRGTSVNGYMTETMMSSEVAAGKKINDNMTIMNSDLEICGIETIADLEMSFHIFDSESWETYLDTELVQINTSAQEGYVYEYDDTGDVLYEDANIKIVKKGLSEDSSLFGPSVMLYIENRMEQPVTVQANDVSVNGFMVDALISEEITPGRHAIADMTFMSSELEENGIENMEDLELSFHIFDTDTWDTITDTDVIAVKF